MIDTISITPSIFRLCHQRFNQQYYAIYSSLHFNIALRRLDPVCTTLLRLPDLPHLRLIVPLQTSEVPSIRWLGGDMLEILDDFRGNTGEKLHLDAIGGDGTDGDVE
ncbi:hypothetical protein ACFX1R_006950 [Malus domestica]